MMQKKLDMSPTRYRWNMPVCITKKNEGENVNLGPLFVTMTSMPFFYGADEFLQQGRCIPTLVIMAASCYPNGFNWNALPLIQQ